MDSSAPISMLPFGPVASMDEAVTRMSRIASLLPSTDGLACFNRMYLIVTRVVRQQASVGFFADPDFMARMDVDFVNRYLGAIDAFRAQPPNAPRAWSVLLASRLDPGVAPMQFALAGMNAHINFDLAAAVVQTCEDLGTAPDVGPHRADFDKVNQLLASLDQRIRESFEQGALADLDRQFAGLENVIGTFSITAARETAWVNAHVLWQIRGERFLYEAYLDGIDRSVAFAGRALLIPLAKLPEV